MWWERRCAFVKKYWGTPQKEESPDKDSHSVSQAPEKVLKKDVKLLKDIKIEKD